MEWEPGAQALLARVNESIPGFVRGMVQRVVVKESERLAAEGGAARVTAEHVRAAYRLRTPRPMQPLLLRVLGEEPAGAAHQEPSFAVGEPMTPDEIAAFLAWERTGRLATVSADGRPYVVPLSFVYDGGAVYYHWFSDEGRKVQNLRANRQVCFEADWSTRDHLSYRSVIADGVIEEVAETPERARVLALLAARFPEYATGAGHALDVQEIIHRGMDAMAEAVRIYRVRIVSISGKKKGHAPA